MSTTWHTKSSPNISWCLEDGTILEAPPIETSGSGRRVRIEGRQDTSTPHKDERHMLALDAQERANRHNSPILLCFNPRDIERIMKSTEEPAEFDLDGESFNMLKCVWTFKHASLPIVAKVIAELSRRWASNYELKLHAVFTEVSSDIKHPKSGSIENGAWKWSKKAAHPLVAEEALDATGQQDLFIRYESSYKHPREAIAQLREAIEDFDNLESFLVPDLRDPFNVAFFTLDFYDTNVEGELHADLADYLDTRDLVQEAAQQYEDLRTSLRRLGIELGSIDDDAFAKAFMTKNDQALSVRVTDGDTSHRIFLHLPTGTLSLSCANSAPREAAEKWELARFEAEMKGELDAFLGFFGRSGEDEVIDTISRRTY